MELARTGFDLRELVRLMYRAAAISACKRYRTHLVRRWGPGARLVVCMLNPSRADAELDDPTILALILFAMAWGYGGIEVINLRAWRTSSPRDLFAAEADGIDTIGPDNEASWYGMRTYARCNNLPILVAWGNNAPAADVARFSDFFGRTAFGVVPTVQLICLGTTARGAPIHPAARGKHRVPRDQQPIHYQLEANP